MNIGLRVIGLLVAATAVAVAEMRTWTFEASGKTVQGEVLGFAGTAVTLKDADGKTFSVPIAYLTESNRTYLAAERAKQWKEVEVFKLEGEESGGRYKRCTVHGQAVNGQVLIQSLPSAVEAILSARNQRAAPIAALSQQINNENQAVKQAKASIPTGSSGYGPYRQAVRVETRRGGHGCQGPQERSNESGQPPKVVRRLRREDQEPNDGKDEEYRGPL